MQKLTAETVFTVLQGKEIALIGLGVSHRPVARLLARKGMNVTVYDKKSPQELGEPPGSWPPWGWPSSPGRTTCSGCGGM